MRGVDGRITTSAASTSGEPRHDTSTAITTLAPMRRATGTGTRLDSPPSTYSVPWMMTGQNTFGMLLDARTASPVLPRLKIVMRLGADVCQKTLALIKAMHLGKEEWAPMRQSGVLQERLLPYVWHF